MEPSLSLSLSGTVETDGHMLAALVRRVTFNQVTLATPPFAHREHTSNVDIRIRVTPPVHRFPSTIERAQCPFVTRFRFPRSGRIYESHL